MIGAGEQSMTEAIKQLLLAQSGGREPRLVVRTGTRVDTGRWLRRSALWLCLTDDRLMMLAASRRAYCQSMPLTDAADSWYCHTTGQLVIEPNDSLRFNRLDMTPAQALSVLEQIKNLLRTAAELTGPAMEKNRA